MPETTKTRPVVKTHQLNFIPAVRLTNVLDRTTKLSSSAVDRTTKLSEDLLKTLETSERAAIEALGQFVIAIEEALPQEIAGTSDVAKKITESGLQMADRLVHAQHEFLRSAISSTGKSLSIRNGAKAPSAAPASR